MIISETNICVTTTAMPRPELLDLTYKSFFEKSGLYFPKLTLFINVDPFPNFADEGKRQECIEISKKYFGNVVSNLPNSSNFPRAVKWCFSQVKDFEYVFHLEDDWELLKPLNLKEISQVIENKIQIGLRSWTNSENRFVLSPNFIKSSFCIEAAEKWIIPHKNPEEQIRKKNTYLIENFIIYPNDEKNIVLKDTGREWLDNTMYKRQAENFTSWQFVPFKKIKNMYIDQNKYLK